MAYYVMLSKLTRDGAATIKTNPWRIKNVNHEMEKMGVRVVHQFMTLGPYDFVNIVEAEDAAAVAEGISFYQGMVEAVWSACPDFDIGATASVRWYSDGNRRTSLSLTPAYRPLAWRGFYLGARYSTILSERAEPWYWTPDQLDGAYALAGFRGRALGGYLGVEAQGGLAREKMFAEPPEPAPPDSWEAAYGGSLYWEAPRRRRLDGRIQLNYSQTPEYEELQAGARILLRF